jgi:PIN domain nuclease of toxin-antitoxin system
LKILLDTHAFLWFFGGDRRMSRKARTVLTDPANEPFISVASVWEMAVKASLGRLQLPLSVGDYVAEKARRGFHVLPLELSHAARVQTLPFIHQDPFDRMIVAQALVEDMPLVSADMYVRQYPVTVLW